MGVDNMDGAMSLRGLRTAGWRYFAQLRGAKRAGVNIVILMTGAAAAQALTLLSVPVISRLYNPSSFGLLSVCGTVVLLAVPLNSIRYEMAIVPASSEDDATGLLMLACGISMVTGAAIGFLIHSRALLSALGVITVRRYTWMVAAAVIVSGMAQALQQYAIRRRRFPRIAASQAVQSGVSASGQICSAMGNRGGPFGLLMGYLLGLVAGAVVLKSDVGFAITTWWRNHKRSVVRSLWHLAKQYRDYPCFLPWGGFLDVAAQKLPILMIPTFFGVQFLGLYAIADRLLRTPLSLVGQASSQVLFQKMTERNVQVRMPEVLMMWATLMTLGSLVPFATLVCFGSSIFSLALGKPWAGAGTIAALLVPLYWGALVVSPVSSLLIVANRQRILVTIQVLFFLAGIASLWIGKVLFNSGTRAILLYSISQFGIYILYFGTLLHVAKRLQGLGCEASACAA